MQNVFILAGFFLISMPCLGLGIDARASSFEIVANIDAPLDEVSVQGQLAADSNSNLYVETNRGLYELTASSGYSSAELLPFSSADGYNGLGGVAVTKHNTLLVTTIYGAKYGLGTVVDLGRPFSITPTVLHVFTGGYTSPTDGSFASGLTLGEFNHYYGATRSGGRGVSPSTLGDGTLYSVVASTTDPRYRILHNFGGLGDGINPSLVKLATDAQGNIYGATTGGGANGLGTIFTLQYVGGVWQEKVIYSFAARRDFEHPTGNVVLDAKGNLYTCGQGGSHDRGGILSLAPPAPGEHRWRETILYEFGNGGRYDPIAANTVTGTVGTAGCGITLDQTSNLIVGTTVGGGAKDRGTIFTLTPPVAGQTSWIETVAHSFGQTPEHGETPYDAPFQLGSTYYGGSSGAIYAFTP